LCNHTKLQRHWPE